MSTKTHKKLCWNCDGYVHVYEIKCPYCGAVLSEYNEEKTREPNLDYPISHALEERSYSQVAADSFDPPYQSYGQNFAQEPQVGEARQDAKSKKNPAESQDVQNPVASLLLLIPGSVLFILGIMLAFFSTDGFLTFQFKSKFSIFYLLGALPLLYLGYKSLFPKKERTIPFDEHSFTNPLER